MFIKLDITMIQGPKNAFDFNNAKPAYYSLLRPVMPTKARTLFDFSE